MITTRQRANQLCDAVYADRYDHDGDCQTFNEHEETDGDPVSVISFIDVPLAAIERYISRLEPFSYTLYRAIGTGDYVMIIDRG